MAFIDLVRTRLLSHPKVFEPPTVATIPYCHSTSYGYERPLTTLTTLTTLGRHSYHRSEQRSSTAPKLLQKSEPFFFVSRATDSSLLLCAIDDCNSTTILGSRIRDETNAALTTTTTTAMTRMKWMRKRGFNDSATASP